MLIISAALLTRMLLIVLFLPFSALDKVLNFRQAAGQAAQAVSNLSVLLVAAGFALEVTMSLAVLTGIADRLAASILALYCCVTALLWKQFWKQPDFSLRGVSAGREVFWDFLKNASLAGGFLILAFGPDGSGLVRLFEHPFASTQPYAHEVGTQ
jgi:putative oxidoreductase